MDVRSRTAEKVTPREGTLKHPGGTWGFDFRGFQVYVQTRVLACNTRFDPGDLCRHFR
jgi:hypothetical protein